MTPFNVSYAVVHLWWYLPTCEALLSNRWFLEVKEVLKLLDTKLSYQILPAVQKGYIHIGSKAFCHKGGREAHLKSLYRQDCFSFFMHTHSGLNGGVMAVIE